jgi:hypothetical protein
LGSGLLLRGLLIDLLSQANVSWAKASAAAASTARHPIQEVEEATVRGLIREYSADEVQFLGERIVIPDDNSDDDEDGPGAPGPEVVVDSLEGEGGETVDAGNAVNNGGLGLTRSAAPSVESDASDKETLFVSER